MMKFFKVRVDYDHYDPNEFPDADDIYKILYDSGAFSFDYMEVTEIESSETKQTR